MVSTVNHKYYNECGSVATLTQVLVNEKLALQVFEMPAGWESEDDVTVVQIFSNGVKPSDLLKYVECHCPEWEKRFCLNADGSTVQVVNTMDFDSYLNRETLVTIVEAFAKTL